MYIGTGELRIGTTWRRRSGEEGVASATSQNNVIHVHQQNTRPRYSSGHAFILTMRFIWTHGSARPSTAMTRSDIIAALSTKFPTLQQGDVVESAALIINAITQALANGRRAEVRGFGVFSVTAKRPRTGRNPKTGAPVAVPAKHAPHFKPGKELAKRVDASRSPE